MAQLLTHQKITRVRPSNPFGNGHDGAKTGSGAWSPPSQPCSGTISTSTLTLAGAGSFANDDLILIHQSRGSGVGQWEINKIVSGGGTTTLTLAEPLSYTYLDSGASQSQCILLFEYTSFNPSGTFTLDGWNENNNGIAIFAVNGTATVDESFTANSKGFSNQGEGSNSGDNTSYQGEGSGGAGADGTTTANGNGGGGVNGGSDAGPGGGGGGNGTAGTQGETAQSQSGGSGGNTAGDADLTTVVFGGQGGGGRGELNGAGNGGNGGNGGGIVMIFAKNIVVTGGIVSNGEDGQNASVTATDGAGGGGGGAGGSILIACETATLGANLITATAGSGGSKGDTPAGDGGDGGVGRIAVHYGKSVTGTTNPTFNSQQDDDLIESSEQTNYFIFI